MIPRTEHLMVGVAVGRGTGPELADVFIKVLNELATYFGIQIDIYRSSRIYHSYQSLFSAGNDLQYIRDETARDAKHYEDFVREQAAQGTNVIFRTAFTAQSLYLVRQHLEAVKVERFRKQSADVLLVRDQAQGFYTGSNTYSSDGQAVSRTSHFDKAIFDRIIKYSLLRADKCWGENIRVDCIILVYKHHLFDGLFDVWAQEWSKEFDLRIQLVQPDTMNRNLLAFGTQEHQLIIAGNEYADIMEVLLMDMFERSVQETTYSENVYLSPEMNNLAEYQTVHGSADDLTGKGVVNPSATLKAAAAILEHHGLCKGIESGMNSTIEALARQKNCTPDQGGSATTAAYVSAVLHHLEKSYNQQANLSLSGRGSLMPIKSTSRPLRPDLPTLGLRTALVIMDFQRDFAATINASSPPLSSLINNIARLLSYIRNAQREAASPTAPQYSSTSPVTIIGDIEIIHIQFLGDPSYQSAPWAYRNATSHRPENCLSGTEGANFIEPITPQPNERVFQKRALFDPFMIPDFETHLRSSGVEHLMLAGLYGDVCVDAAARSGFQKGFWISVMQGCVGNLFSTLEDWQKYAGMVYGARVLSVETFEGPKANF